MQVREVFLNEASRLRSGWRLAVFLAAFIALLLLLGAITGLVFGIAARLHIDPGWALREFVFRIVFLVAAVGAGWLCNRFIEGLPWPALGLSFYAGWWRHFLVGTLIGAFSLGIAVLIALVSGGLRLEFSGRTMLYPVARALVGTAGLFIVAALAEESAFRGYPLQTLTRAKLIWLGVFITSVPFAIAHWHNPGATIFSTLNTALAGVWLAAAYLRTRSLWFPLGVHWAWNWAQGSIFGLAVSGLNLSGHTLLRAIEQGPAWLTGGSYGIEGGAACTAALLVSMALIWQQHLARATPELQRLTSEEIHRPGRLRESLELSN